MRKRPASIDNGIQSQSDIDFTKYKLIQMAAIGPNVLTICQVARPTSGFWNSATSSFHSSKVNSSIFEILYELDDLEDKNLGERKREQLLRRKLSGNNLGGRPKISPLKESLVIRLRNEGYSYRSIRSQTGIALSTIRRVILEGELT